jgi:hypothetical protein
MALDDSAIDREFAASMLKAFREDYGARGNRDAIEGSAYSTGKYFSAVLDTETRNVLIEILRIVALFYSQVRRLVQADKSPSKK